jgi:hypothetical protein
VVFSTNKIGRHDVAETLLKVALNTIKKIRNDKNVWMARFCNNLHQVLL